MQRQRYVTEKLVLWTACFLVVCANSLVATPVEIAEVSYRVVVANPESRILRVCGQIINPRRSFLQLDWPAWTPGYAALWNYGQHVHQLTAESETGGRLATQRISENRWVIPCGGARAVRFCYDVFATDTDNDLGFVQAYLDSSGGWYNGAALFAEINGFRNAPHTVRFELPRLWRIATAMRPLNDGTGYLVADYDELVDSPVQLGTFVDKTITIAGVPIWIVVAGRPSVNMDDLATMTQKIAECQFGLMGDPGLDRYLFIYHAAKKGAGGLEHRHSVTISLRQEEYDNIDSWLKVVAAHELFHVWNAKRIHTELFDQYDYSRPHRSKQVWFAEGITAYYTDLTLCRAGLITREEVYKSLAEILDQYENNRVHRQLSWEDIGWYIWDEEVRRGLGVWLLPGWMIDLKLRDATDNRSSLDDVMRFMNVWYGESERGYEESGLGAICSAVAQRDLVPFFDRHIAGYDPFPYDTLFAAAGLQWKKTTRSIPDIGCDLFWSLQATVKLVGVDEGGLAARSGLRSGDLVLALNGFVAKNRQDLASFKSRLTTGDTLRIRYRRGGTDAEAVLQIGQRSIVKSYIDEVDHPTERQRRILDGILRGDRH
ncbi:MAG: M61 family metallopeptidase [Bacteroidetes bacterium]|nr:M61 family metallopeptidase [Bacteroidota bacterium]